MCPIDEFKYKVSFYWNNWNYSQCRYQIRGHRKFLPFYQEEIPKENTNCSYADQPLEGDDDQVLTALIRILGLVFRLVPNYSQCFCFVNVFCTDIFLFCFPPWPKLQELILPVGIVILVEMSFLFFPCQCVFHGGVLRTLLEN